MILFCTGGVQNPPMAVVAKGLRISNVIIRGGIRKKVLGYRVVLNRRDVGLSVHHD